MIEINVISQGPLLNVRFISLYFLSHRSGKIERECSALGGGREKERERER